jgi:hypothetical protein
VLCVSLSTEDGAAVSAAELFCVRGRRFGGGMTLTGVKVTRSDSTVNNDVKCVATGGSAVTSCAMSIGGTAPS